MCRETEIAAFWRFSSNQALLMDSERLHQIKVGFPAQLIHAFRLAFDLHLETLLNASISTLKRRLREQKNLDSVASERLDRIATVSHLAEGVFDSQARAVHWMSMPNKALGGTAPIMLCETEIGAKQVRRVLQALDWGAQPDEGTAGQRTLTQVNLCPSRLAENGRLLLFMKGS